MKFQFSLVTLAMVAAAAAQGVTDEIAPEGEPPADSSPNLDGTLEIAVNKIDPAAKIKMIKRRSPLAVCSSFHQL